MLPGEEPSDDTASDYIAELGMNLNDKWNLDLGYQWDSDQGVTQLAEARVLYRADDFRIVNLSYRFRRGSVREIDVAGAWPIGDRWNIVGRYDYSLLDDQPLERFVGIDYSTCCWGVRLVAVRNLTTPGRRVRLGHLAAAAAQGLRQLPDRGREPARAWYSGRSASTGTDPPR